MNRKPLEKKTQTHEHLKNNPTEIPPTQPNASPIPTMRTDGFRKMKFQSAEASSLALRRHARYFPEPQRFCFQPGTESNRGKYVIKGTRSRSKGQTRVI